MMLSLKKSFDPYASMPTQVRVGSFVYKVEVEELADATANREFGHTNHMSKKIRLHPQMEPQELADTFIHEVLHAMCYFHDLEDDDNEETYVTRLAHAMVNFWRENPDVVSWWADVVQEAS